MHTDVQSFTHARLIYPHQLFTACYKDNKTTLFILIEDDLFFKQFRFHKQKLILHRASMSEFRQSLEKQGFKVEYIESSSAASMDTLKQLLEKYKISKVSYFDLVDNWLEQRLTRVLDLLNIEVNRFNSPGFLTTRGQIIEFFDTHPNRMQHFYEWQRKRLDILIDGNKPTGGKWSYDASNRKKLPKNITLPETYQSNISQPIKNATRWVEQNFPSNPGSSAHFRYPVTHDQARIWLDDFIKNRLPQFGPYEDAIHSHETEMFHSVLSPLINCGLLTPQEIIEAVKDLPPETIPIESLEGFIRQIIGWREYMRATYTHYGSKMRTQNHLHFTRSLPKSWWSGAVGIEPIDVVIKNVLDTGYAHHIERLMILGNSMVLLRIKPDDVYEWFMSLFVDAYDWVMVPNVYAMSQFAAGELITTKPYVSGSNYIIKMSDYKKSEWSEIWDALYWQFVSDHRELLEANYRSAMVVKLYDRLETAKKDHHAKIASEWL